jgi:hypothetical protein
MGEFGPILLCTEVGDGKDMLWIADDPDQLGDDP